MEALANERFYEAHEAVGPLAAGHRPLRAVPGAGDHPRPHGADRVLFPATAVAVAVNVALNLLLVPDHGIIGAGVALLVSYAVVVVLMHAITRRLFYVPYEWGRLALATGLAAGLVAVGELAVPHDGIDGLALTLALCATYPIGLYVLRFLSAEERARLGALFDRALPGRRGTDRDLDAIEQAQRDSDRGGAA